jgi:translation elongation factor EF-G
MQAAHIVRVAVEPVHPADMPKLINGLKLLSQSDPCVETFQQKTGEHVVLGAGFLHLEVKVYYSMDYLFSCVPTEVFKGSFGTLR